MRPGEITLVGETQADDAPIERENHRKTWRAVAAVVNTVIPGPLRQHPFQQSCHVSPPVGKKKIMMV
jgi:hypothetical protein